MAETTVNITEDLRKNVVQIVNKSFVDKEDLDLLYNAGLKLTKVGDSPIMDGYIKYELKDLRPFNIRRAQGVLILSAPLYLKK